MYRKHETFIKRVICLYPSGYFSVELVQLIPLSSTTTYQLLAELNLVVLFNSWSNDVYIKEVALTTLMSTWRREPSEFHRYDHISLQVESVYELHYDYSISYRAFSLVLGSLIYSAGSVTQTSDIVHQPFVNLTHTPMSAGIAIYVLHINGVQT